MPKISVIVPIYNVEKYLRECLDSIADQTLKDLEIICIDDGSPDNCIQILEEYTRKDNRFVVIHKENGGYGQSCNLGLEKATGEYIAIVEPDDYIDKNMYLDLYNIAQNFDSDIVKSGFYDNLQSKTITSVKQVEWDNDKIPQDKSFTIKECSLFLYYHPSIWSCIYKREFINRNNIRFIEAKGAGWTDNPFQVQTMCLAERINYTPKAYYYWRRLNADESDDLKDYTVPFKRCKEIHNWLEENKIIDQGFLDNLYKRELSYIRMVLKKDNIENLPDFFMRIKTICQSMDANVILHSKNIKNKNKKFYILCKKSPLFVYLIVKLKLFRKRIITIRINKHEKCISLLNRFFVWKGKTYE